MNRRDFGKYVLASTVGIGVGTTAMSRDSTAQVKLGELNVSDASKTTRDGQIKDVTLSVSGKWQYDIPAGNDPNTWNVTLAVTNGDKVATIAETSGRAMYLNGNGNYSLSGSLTETELYDTETFEIKEDGKVKTVTVGIVVLFTVQATSGKVLAKTQLEDTSKVSVTNSGYTATTHGQANGQGTIEISA